MNYLGDYIPGLTGNKRWLGACAILIALALVNLRGIKVAGWLAVILQTIVFIPVIWLCVLALFHWHHNPMLPFVPPGKPLGTVFGSGLALAMWNYAGYEQLSSVTREMKDPQRTFARLLVWNTPLTSLVARLGKAHIRSQVSDPWLRRQLTPDFTPGCKRMLISSDYYPALQRDNCKLIDWPIATMSPAGIRTSDGIEHHVDCVVFATGYDVHLTGPPYTVTGIGGRSLAQEWAGGAQAYKSINAHGYPNLFFMTGPNSGPGHNSLLVYVEGQLDYAVRAITTILNENLRYLDVRADVQRRYNDRIQKRLAKTTWMSGCSSWYLTADGFNAAMYPGFATQYLRQMRDFRFRGYEAVAHDAIGARVQA